MIVKFIQNLFFVVIIFSSNYLMAQNNDSIRQDHKHQICIFNSMRVINGHSASILKRNELNFNLTQRFGDMGSNGTPTIGLGLDSIADMRLGLAFGLWNKLTIGIGRSKGIGPFTQIADGYIKYNLIKSKNPSSQLRTNGFPDSGISYSASLLQTMAYTFMKESADTTLSTSFAGKNVRRMAYSSQLLLNTNMYDKFNVLLSPTYVHRNYVAFEDKNGLFSCGIAVQYKVCKWFGVSAEYFQNFRKSNSILGVNYKNPLAVGFVFNYHETNFNFTIGNSAGIGETQFLPYTSGELKNGQLKMGFTLSHSLQFLYNPVRLHV